jgi:hypothetical protein
MRFNSKSIVLAGSLAALTLSLVACHGQSPGGAAYVPASTSALPVSQVGPLDRDKKVDIESTCGHRLHIVIAAVVDCKFHEKGYGAGLFTVSNDVNGIVTVSPQSGDRRTVFTILGALVGTGHLTWKDSKGNEFKITVKVTL